MEDLSCKSVRLSLWDYVANSLEADARDGIAAHLTSCRDCELHSAEVQSLRSGLKHLPLKHVPPILTTKLRILASREHARRLVRRDLASWLVEQKSRVMLMVDNLLRPFAVPAAGGILCSFICFGIIVDYLHVVPDWQDDIPIGISTEVAIDELSPFCFVGQDVMVQLTVDSDGKVTDYAIPQKANPSSEELQEIGNLVLYSTFTPATRAGRRVSSKRLVYMSHYSVKG